MAKVLLYAQLTDIVGHRELTVNEVKGTAALEACLHERYPALKQQRYLVAVDREIVSVDTPVTDHSVVALLPPFSGG